MRINENRIPKYTTWAPATTSLLIAIRELLRCLNFGFNAWIERQENGQQFYPIKIKNPRLDREDGWKIVEEKKITEEELLEKHNFFNHTVRRMTLESERNGKHCLFKPKGGIPNYVPKPMKRKVYVICFNTKEKLPGVWIRLVQGALRLYATIRRNEAHRGVSIGSESM